MNSPCWISPCHGITRHPLMYSRLSMIVRPGQLVGDFFSLMQNGSRSYPSQIVLSVTIHLIHGLFSFFSHPLHSYLLSLISYLPLHSYLLSLISYLSPPISYLLSLISYLLSLISHPLSPNSSHTHSTMTRLPLLYNYYIYG